MRRRAAYLGRRRGIDDASGYYIRLRRRMTCRCRSSGELFENGVPDTVWYGQLGLGDPNDNLEHPLDCGISIRLIIR